MKKNAIYRSKVQLVQNAFSPLVLDELRLLVTNDFSELNFVIELNNSDEISRVVRKVKHLFYKIDQLEGVLLCNEIVKENNCRVKMLKCKILCSLCNSLLTQR